MATAIIGGKEYIVPPLNFAALERAWPFIEEAMMTADPMVGTSAGLSIIAAGLIEREDFDPKENGVKSFEKVYDPEIHAEEVFEPVVACLKRRLLASEISHVREAVDKITQEAGLEPAAGEAQEAALAEAGSLSEETAQSSLLNLLQPDAKEGAGEA